MTSDKEITFLQWALTKMGYRWEGFRKPRGQILKRVRRRMQELQLTGGYPEYRRYLENHPGEWETLDRLCDVTISKFFRDRKLWEYLRDSVMPELLADKNSEPVTPWSIGCCNGEEPYSLAMINEQLSMNNGNTERIVILATDRNAEVLKRAKNGRYPAGALKELKEEEIEAFFHPVNRNRASIEDEEYKIAGRLKRFVTYEQRDIRDSMPEGSFDIMLCRNLVFTYFDREEQIRFLNRLKPHLKGDGYLVIGAHEEIPPNIEWLESASGTHRVFRKC